MKLESKKLSAAAGNWSENAAGSLYLHPAGAKALKRYALDADTKVHTLLLDAVEAWFKSHGLREPVRITHEEQKED